MKKNKILNILVKYSLLFCLLSFVIITIFIKNNKSFVWINLGNDGLDQHLINLHLFKNLLNDFFATGELNTFTFSIGYGMDMFANFAYYLFGDFLAYLVAFFSHDALDNLYNILVFLRLYLVGISFILYCSYKKIDSFPTLIGSLVYTFCSFAIFSMARHPYFVNAIILFPLLLIGIEKIILKNEKIFFTIMVAIMFICSFYFAYMFSLILIVYAIILVITHFKKDVKKIIKRLLTTLLCAILGVSISAVILVPTAYAFINSTRTDSYLYFYTFPYYKRLLASLISIENTGNWSLIGVSSIILVILPIIFKKRKKYGNLVNFLLVMLVPLLVPTIATVFDGMAFPNNRWAFVIAFLFSILTVYFFNNNESVDKKKSIFWIILYTFVLVLVKKINLQIVLSLIVAIIFTLIIDNKKKLNKYYEVSILLLLLFNIGFNIYYFYSDKHYNYVGQFVSTDANNLYNNANGEILYLNEAANYLNSIDKDYYNVIIYPNKLFNLSLMNDYNSISYFYSIVSNNYLELATDLENQELGINKEIKNFNNRSMITTLLGVKYIITTDINYVPYGYELIKNFNDNTYIYKNNYNTSFVKYYNSYISLDNYNSLSPLEKEDSLLKHAVLDNSNSNYISNNITSTDYNVIDEFNIYNNNFVNVEDISKNSISIDIEDVSNKEVYLYIKNVKFDNKYNSYFKDISYGLSVNVNNKIFNEGSADYRTNAYYYENNNILINLGYYEELSSNIEIIFNKVGKYTFDSLEILTLNFDNYDKDINNLNMANFILDEYNNNYLSGTVNIFDDGVLQFTTNYSDGFKVYVDDIEVDTFKCNKYFLGINISKGRHKIKIKYETPFYKIGSLISFCGIIILSIFIFNERKRSKK